MLAHLFTYYYYNYTSYPSQDCETIFYTTLVTEYYSGIFFLKSTQADKTNWQHFLKKLIYYLHCDM